MKSSGNGSKEIWTPFIGEDLECKKDLSNTRDAYAIGILRQEETGSTAIVGHVPQKISTACSFSYKEKGVSVVSSEVTGDLPQGGLEVPCKLKFQGSSTLVSKIRKLIAESTKRDQSDNNKPVPQEPENISVVKSIKGEDSNAVVKQHDKQHKLNEIIDIESVQCTTLNDGPKLRLSFSCITLTIIDQGLIIQGKKLNDKHLNFSQAILKK